MAQQDFLFQPIDHDPFSEDAALAGTMTHWPEGPNPAAPYLDMARNFAKGGVSEVLRGSGVQLPDWSNRISDIAQSENFNTALGIFGGPLKSERFSWPVRTTYGKTIDMPVSVNPSRFAIARELAQAPHGDVRAVRSPNGDVYMWPANEAMHVDIANTFDLPFKTRQELQAASYLFNKGDVDKLGKFADFDDLIKKLAASGTDTQALRRQVLSRDASGRPLRTAPFNTSVDDAILEAGANRMGGSGPQIVRGGGTSFMFRPIDHDPFSEDAALAGTTLTPLKTGAISARMSAQLDKLYHVVGSDYEAGQPLQNLYRQHGDDAYDLFAQRWPEAGDLGQYHVHQTFLYDNLKEALDHAANFGGRVLSIDPKKLTHLERDKLEIPGGKKEGFWFTRDDVPAGAISEIGQ